ncbi:MarC family protein [Candidatus Chlamydia sanziniae]|nr:MarC family protein [Candidatus Chlamydia sanziniae]
MIPFFFLLPQACILALAADSLTNTLVLHRLIDHYSQKQRLLLLLRESGFALIIIFVLYQAAFGGLRVLNTPVCAIQVVAGIAVTLSGVRAVLRLAKEDNWKLYLSKTPNSFPCVTPIAIPLMIGPSWLAACCALIAKKQAFITNAQILILSWIFISAATLILHSLKGKRKDKILLAAQTILGLFVTIVGTQLLISGLQKAFL